MNLDNIHTGIYSIKYVYIIYIFLIHTLYPHRQIFCIDHVTLYDIAFYTHVHLFRVHFIHILCITPKPTNPNKCDNILLFFKLHCI